MTPTTPLWLHADKLAGGQLGATILDLAAAGHGKRTIARKLHDAYGVTVSHPTVANWLAILRAENPEAGAA